MEKYDCQETRNILEKCAFWPPCQARGEIVTSWMISKFDSIFDVTKQKVITAHPYVTVVFSISE